MTNVVRRANLATSALLLLAMSGCGTQPQLSDTTPLTTQSHESPRYFFETVSKSVTSRQLIYPRKLEDALPNVRHRAFGKQITMSDRLIVGTVSAVEKGEARRHTADDEYEIVDFDDPEADERSAVMTVGVDESYPAGASETIKVRFGLMGATDPQRFVASLGDLKRVAIGLQTVSGGRDAGTLIPALGGQFVGEVAADGSIDFAGLRPDEWATDGVATAVDSIPELRASAKRGPLTLAAAGS